MRAVRTAAGVGVAVLVGLVAAVGVGAGPASAHVSVNPREAEQGGFAKLAFRVPNERDDAATVKVEVHLPIQEAPIASVSVRPTPGWTATVERGKLTTPLKVHDSEVTEAVAKITWTAAAGNEVKPGQFQEFEISAGPLPEVDQVVFKALQTYSSGEIVRWIEEPTGGAEPEHPAPVLKLTKAADTNAPAAANTDSDSDTDLASSSSDSSDDGGSGLALAAGFAGLAAGLAGLVLGVLAWRRAAARTS